MRPPGLHLLRPAAGGMASTFGGPKINKDAQVVNFERRPIPGLYAAGAAAGQTGEGAVAGPARDGHLPGRLRKKTAERRSFSVEKLRFSDNLCFDFAKHGRPKVPIRKLSPS